MKANPGGHIDPKSVFGRDRLIESIWERLNHQCVLLNAERRIGKTSVIGKMVAEPREGWLPLFQDLEKIHSAPEFAVVVYEQIQKYLSFWKRTANRAKKIFEDHEFQQIKKARQRPWKNLLTASVQDLMAAQEKKRLAMFWDEVPYMIDNVRKAEGEQAAIEILDTLRSLRQENPSLRMVFTGSIGLHHVLANIRDSHIASAPVNDMFAIEVTPLAPADAEALAKELIKGENLRTADINESAATIASEADCFPFYIHHVVNGLKLDGIAAEPQIIRELVQRQLTDANDPWELGHFRDRIPTYYRQANDAKLVCGILDALATAPNSMAINELQNAINTQSAEFDDRDRLIRVLRLLERDHYVSRDPNGSYKFRFPLIRRWWRLDRGL